MSTRRIAAAVALVVSVATAIFMTSTGSDPSSAVPEKQAVMYKPLQCGCCDDYAKYLERHGFEVEVKALKSLAEIKRTAGVPKGFEGCHTLLVDGYTVEGLVPIETLQKLLTEKPAIKGITLPGMPWGAPGMDQRPKTAPLVVYAIEGELKAPRVYPQE